MITNCFGYKIIASDAMVDPMTREVSRTWKERLFSRPWTPFMKTKIETYYVPSDEIIMDNINHVIYAHPAMVDKIKKTIEAENDKFKASARFDILNSPLFNFADPSS